MAVNMRTIFFVAITLVVCGCSCWQTVPERRTLKALMDNQALRAASMLGKTYDPRESRLLLRHEVPHTFKEHGISPATLPKDIRSALDRGDIVGLLILNLKPWGDETPVFELPTGHTDFFLTWVEEEEERLRWLQANGEPEPECKEEEKCWNCSDTTCYRGKKFILKMCVCLLECPPSPCKSCSNLCPDEPIAMWK